MKIYPNLKLLKNNATFLTFLSTLSRFGIGLAVLPVMLLKFNSYEISLWLFLTTLLSLISLASFGFGQSTVRCINYFISGYPEIPKSINQFNFESEKLKQNQPINKKGIGDILFLTSKVYIVLCVLSIFLISSLGVLVSWNIMSLGNHSFQNWASFALVGLIAILRIQFSRLVSIIEGFNQVAKIRLLESSFGLIKILLFLSFIILGFEIIHLFLIELFLQILANFRSNKLIKKIITKENISYSKTFNFEMLNQIWPSTWRYGLMLFSSYFINNGTILVVAQLSDTIIISSYLLTVRVLMIIRSLTISQFNANYPYLIRLVVSKDFLSIKILLTSIIRNSLTLLTLSLLFIYFFGNDIINILSKDIQILENYLFIIMSIGIFLETHHGIHANIYLSTNHVPFLWPGFISGILIILISSILIQTYGLLGIVLTQFFIQLSFNNWFSVYLNLKLLKWNFSEYSLNVLNLKSV